MNGLRNNVCADVTLGGANVESRFRSVECLLNCSEHCSHFALSGVPGERAGVFLSSQVSPRQVTGKDRWLTMSLSSVVRMPT